MYSPSPSPFQWRSIDEVPHIRGDSKPPGSRGDGATLRAHSERAGGSARTGHKAGWPRTTFADSLTLELDTDTVHLWNFGPAHSDGDAVVYFERADVVHMGDLFHGLHDASMGEDMDGMVHTFTETLARIGEDTRVMTGHGALSTYGELRDYRQMLIDTLLMVRARIAGGATAEEIASGTLPEAWVGTFGEDGAGPWLSAIYSTLVGR